jgi:hypothetical protein
MLQGLASEISSYGPKSGAKGDRPELARVLDEGDVLVVWAAANPPAISRNVLPAIGVNAPPEAKMPSFFSRLCNATLIRIAFASTARKA